MATAVSAQQRRLIGELCRGFRAWAPRDETRPPRPRGLLGGGFSNLNVLLAGTRRHYVLRIARGAARGVDRRREARLLRAAAARQLAPAPLLCDPRRGLLITPFLACDRTRDSDPAQLATLLRRIHRLPCRGPRTDAAAQLALYRRRLPAADPCARLLQGAGPLLAQAAAQARASAAPPALCHHDLLRANRCRSGRRLLALDWEYAAPGDPFFDLAVCASELSEAHTAALLAHYLGGPPAPAQRRRLAAQSLLYAALEAAWWRLHGAPSERLPDAALRRLAARLQRGIEP